MEEINKYVIPPIIKNWIENLNNPHNPAHIKENYARMLNNVQEACATEITKYRTIQLANQKSRNNKRG